MQVSNETEQSTDYRMGASGGGTTSPDKEIWGQLQPKSADKCELLSDAKSCSLEFYIEKQLVASITCFKDPGALTLVQDDWGFWIKRDLAA